MRTLSSVGRWLRRELVAARPVFLFFLVGFLLLLSIVKLVLADLSVEVSAFSRSVVGALLAAKAVLILDDTPLARHLENYRRIVAVAVKTLLYGGITLFLGYLEKVLEARHRLHGVGAASRYVISNARMDRLLAWELGISLVFALYFSFYEINQRMGDGALWNLFFESPRPALVQPVSDAAPPTKAGT
jgi:hypothetical protein